MAPPNHPYLMVFSIINHTVGGTPIYGPPMKISDDSVSSMCKHVQIHCSNAPAKRNSLLVTWHATAGSISGPRGLFKLVGTLLDNETAFSCWLAPFASKWPGCFRHFCAGFAACVGRSNCRIFRVRSRNIQK